MTKCPLRLPNTTKFIIAQRVASVQDADKIIVMEGGSIADMGFVARVGITPAQVLFYRAGKQHVFLQHDGDFVTQRLYIIILYVDSADVNVMIMISMSNTSAKRIVEVLDEESDLHNPDSPIYEVKSGDFTLTPPT